ncbi:MerR family transcriptional regulator [Maridesulfovibrio ferrireducens]|uniref:MerR family transcriptional regulator n=1 Tax=Maridesulfovibrio ferrireducens TaxID=246191 RepID=UPI001A31EAE3|nr:MerR family transcriptional regulator [Maridesulfovibrio ferrireducens]MBI9111758.1 MerR family transcriptional regulator [Maridesulfovibrio ferrireducens]
MTDKKLLSIAEISRLLEVPESTLHYWKNRFAQYLPSAGRNRQKRFKPGAVEIFSLIASMLKQGHTTEDVMAELSRKYPVNVAIEQTAYDMTQQPASTQFQQINMEPAIQMAAAMGAEISKSITEGLRGLLSNIPQLSFPSDAPISEELRCGMEKTAKDLNEQGENIQTLQEENTCLKDKLSIMEAELVRLRKDRRELEKYLLDKMKAVTK